jgi:hypothetical protein
VWEQPDAEGGWQCVAMVNSLGVNGLSSPSLFFGRAFFFFFICILLYFLTFFILILCLKQPRGRLSSSFCFFFIFILLHF